MDEKSCGAVVYFEDRFLIVKSRLGHWDLPKGHVEKGESEDETAIREVLEETGLHIVVISGFRDIIKYMPAPGDRKEVVFFLGKARSDKVTMQKSELAGFKWLCFEDALKTLTYDNARMVLEKANEFKLTIMQ